MIHKILIAVMAAMLMASPLSAGGPQKEHFEMLYPAVQVRTGAAVGSGTIIYSKVRDAVKCELVEEEIACEPVLTPGGAAVRECHSFVLTNWHVIRHAVKITESYDPQAKEKIEKEIRSTVEIAWWKYNDLSRAVRTEGAKADIFGYNKTADLALLRIRDTEKCMDNVVHLFPDDDKYFLFEQVWAIGSGLGQPPFATTGILSNLETEINGHPYLLASSDIIFGNSGGSLMRFSEKRDRYELIGVPSRVSAAGFSIVEHMGWSIRIDTIREFLINERVGYILGISKSVDY
jgi:S1-C subfamily serine protease